MYRKRVCIYTFIIGMKQNQMSFIIICIYKSYIRAHNNIRIYSGIYLLSGNHSVYGASY